MQLFPFPVFNLFPFLKFLKAGSDLLLGQLGKGAVNLSVDGEVVPLELLEVLQCVVGQFLAEGKKQTAFEPLNVGLGEHFLFLAELRQKRQVNPLEQLVHSLGGLLLSEVQLLGQLGNDDVDCLLAEEARKALAVGLLFVVLVEAVPVHLVAAALEVDVKLAGFEDGLRYGVGEVDVAHELSLFLDVLPAVGADGVVGLVMFLFEVELFEQCLLFLLHDGVLLPLLGLNLLLLPLVPFFLVMKPFILDILKLILFLDELINQLHKIFLEYVMYFG